MAPPRCARALMHLARFKLRTFLLVVLLAGAGSGFILRRALYIFQVLECVAELENHGAQVCSNFHERYGFYAWEGPEGRSDITQWFLSDPEHVNILSCNSVTTDSVLEKVATLRTLKGLNTANITVTGMRQIVKLTNLESLYFQNSAINDDTVVLLARLPKLERLHLVNCPISDQGLCQLSRIKTLRDLQLEETNVTANGLAALRRCRPDLKIDIPASKNRGTGCVARTGTVSAMKKACCEFEQLVNAPETY